MVDAVRKARRLLGELMYERRYRVRTNGNVLLAEHDAENIFYIAMNWRQLRRALPPRSVTGQDVFLDIGSGMGRAVLTAAAEYPFARVVGVELCRELHDVARENLARTSRRLRCRNVELVCADVREYPVPDDVTVIFINNSIRGSIFRKVLSDLSESMARNPRTVRLIYGNPLEEDALLASGEWRKVRTVQPRRARSTWPYGTTCVYAISGAQTPPGPQKVFEPGASA